MATIYILLCSLLLLLWLLLPILPFMLIPVARDEKRDETARAAGEGVLFLARNPLSSLIDPAIS